jgi:hypothetical protein
VYPSAIMPFRTLLPAAAGGAVLLAQSYSPSLLRRTALAPGGPFRAGRISAVAGIPGVPATYYQGEEVKTLAGKAAAFGALPRAAADGPASGAAAASLPTSRPSTAPSARS